MGIAQYEKYGNPKGYNQNEILNKLITDAIPDSEIEGDYAIVGGYIYELDRSVPKIGKYIGLADGIIITANVSGNGGWFKQGDTVNVTGKIKTYSGGTITTVSATKGETAISDFSIDLEGKYTIDNITEDTTIVINAEDSNGKKDSKTIPITIKMDTIPPTLSNVNVTATASLKIQITATAEDTESGVKNLAYTITSEALEKTITGIFASGETVEVATPTGTIYTIAVTAEDNAGNKSEAQTAEVETRNNSSRSQST